MVSVDTLSISSLIPNRYRLSLQFKVLELVISLETKQEGEDTIVNIHEYLIGDDSGCVILNTHSELQIDSLYEIHDGHTQSIDGYLRLYSNNVQPSSLSLENVNTQNNRSYVQLERKSC